MRIFIVPGVPGNRRVAMKELRKELRFARTEITDSVDGLSYLGELFALNDRDARFIEEELGVAVGVGFPTPGDYIFLWDRSDVAPV